MSDLPPEAVQYGVRPFDTLEYTDTVGIPHRLSVEGMDNDGLLVADDTAQKRRISWAAFAEAYEEGSLHVVPAAGRVGEGDPDDG